MQLKFCLLFYMFILQICSQQADIRFSCIKYWDKTKNKAISMYNSVLSYNIEIVTIKCADVNAERNKGSDTSDVNQNDAKTSDFALQNGKNLSVINKIQNIEEFGDTFNRNYNIDNFYEVLNNKYFYVIALDNDCDINVVLRSDIMISLFDVICRKDSTNLKIQAMCGMKRKNVCNEIRINQPSTYLNDIYKGIGSFILLKNCYDPVKTITVSNTFNDNKLKAMLSEFTKVKGALILDDETDITTNYRFIYYEIIKKMHERIGNDTIILTFSVDKNAANEINKNQFAKSDAVNKIIKAVHYTKFLDMSFDKKLRFKEKSYYNESICSLLTVYEKPFWLQKAELILTKNLILEENKQVFSIHYKYDETKKIEFVIQPYWPGIKVNKIKAKLYYVTKSTNNGNTCRIECFDLLHDCKTAMDNKIDEVSYLFNLVKENQLHDFFDNCTKHYNLNSNEFIADFERCKDIKRSVSYKTIKTYKNCYKKLDNKRKI